LEEGETIFKKKILFAEMIGHAWYTVSYFKISFGKHDKLQQAIERIRASENLTIDLGKKKIVKRLAGTIHKETLLELNYFNSEVPHRFLSPWFDASDKTKAYQFSITFNNDCPYALYKDEIIINPKWIDYLQQNAKVLGDFCHWNLAIYLQGKNPNVPDIPSKLINAPQRKPLN
jgi:hypothetical protein